MANLLGFIDYDHHAGYVHRLAHRRIIVGAETWHGRVSVSLSKEGISRITISDKHGNNERVIFIGNINDELKNNNNNNSINY